MITETPNPANMIRIPEVSAMMVTDAFFVVHAPNGTIIRYGRCAREKLAEHARYSAPRETVIVSNPSVNDALALAAARGHQAPFRVGRGGIVSTLPVTCNPKFVETPNPANMMGMA